MLRSENEKETITPFFSEHTRQGVNWMVGETSPKSCVMSRKRLDAVLAMLKIDISKNSLLDILGGLIQVGLKTHPDSFGLVFCTFLCSWKDYQDNAKLNYKTCRIFSWGVSVCYGLVRQASSDPRR